MLYLYYFDITMLIIIDKIIIDNILFGYGCFLIIRDPYAVNIWLSRFKSLIFALTVERIANHLKEILNQLKMEVVVEKSSLAQNMEATVERISNQAKISLLAVDCKDYQHFKGTELQSKILNWSRNPDWVQRLVSNKSSKFTL